MLSYRKLLGRKVSTKDYHEVRKKAYKASERY